MENLQDILSKKIGLFEKGRTVLSTYESEREGKKFLCKISFELRVFYDTEKHKDVFMWVTWTYYGLRFDTGLAGKKVKNMLTWLFFEARFCSFLGKVYDNKNEVPTLSQVKALWDKKDLDSFVEELYYTN